LTEGREAVAGFKRTEFQGEREGKDIKKAIGKTFSHHLQIFIFILTVEK
jgi:hypothetical protein